MNKILTFKPSNILNDGGGSGYNRQVPGDHDFHMMDYHESQHDAIMHGMQHMKIEQFAHAPDHHGPIYDGSDKRLHLRYDGKETIRFDWIILKFTLANND